MQIVQKLQRNDGPQCVAFSVEMLSRIKNEHNFLSRIIFSEEATFHVSNKVNKHNYRIWHSENPHAVQVERNSRKINVWCVLAHDIVIGPFFFTETSVTANIYLDMLQIYAIPQMQHLQPTVIFQQDAAPPHRSTDIRAFLDTTGYGVVAQLPGHQDLQTSLHWIFSFGATPKTKSTQGRSVMLKTSVPQ
ncbi:hypothetical protein AVEN_259220-1 [Araneus ventricosus]|uniref:Tc1-like transposase DDE domain-containing protein n=1 Tax=Araneus ventricosus TaxID=182803 RepID=A0A4Y2LDE7_ARAVE|nr:hypothetical protein AVEN_259220-1 [Araneus ventricosus]